MHNNSKHTPFSLPEKVATGRMRPSQKIPAGVAMTPAGKIFTSFLTRRVRKGEFAELDTFLRDCPLQESHKEWDRLPASFPFRTIVHALSLSDSFDQSCVPKHGDVVTKSRLTLTKPPAQTVNIDFLTAENQEELQSHLFVQKAENICQFFCHAVDVGGRGRLDDFFLGSIYNCLHAGHGILLLGEIRGRNNRSPPCCIRIFKCDIEGIWKAMNQRSILTSR